MDHSLVQHADILGQPLATGDIVAYRVYDVLAIGRVSKLTPKLVKVSWIRGSSVHRVDPRNLVKLDSSAATMYVLKNSR